MKDCLRLLGHTIRRTFDFGGRAPRAEFIVYVVLSQVAVALIASPAGWFLPESTGDGFRLALQWTTFVPVMALVVRRLHDFGISGRWSLIMLAVAARTFALDLLTQLAGWQTRAGVESLLAYVDWLLFLPFIALYLMLMAAPGTRGSNRFGAAPGHKKSLPETQAAGPGSPEPAV